MFTTAEKKILYTAGAIVLLYLLLSIGLWRKYGAVAGSLPTIAVLITEYILEVRKFKTFKVPAIAWVCKRLVKLKRAKFPLREVVKQEETRVVADLITSISKLLLKDFIQIVAHQQYDLLGAGSQAEKEKAFADLYSQYEEARANEAVRDDVELRKQLLALEARTQAITFNIGILKERYSIEAVRGLQHFFKDFYGKPLYSFSLKTMEADIKKVQISEKATARKYKELLTLYESLQKGKKGGASTPDAIENNFIDTIIWIKEVLKISFDENTISVLMYARLESKAGKVMAYHQEQAEKAKQKK